MLLQTRPSFVNAEELTKDIEIYCYSSDSLNDETFSGKAGDWVVKDTETNRIIDILSEEELWDSYMEIPSEEDCCDCCDCCGNFEEEPEPMSEREIRIDTALKEAKKYLMNGEKFVVVFP